MADENRTEQVLRSTLYTAQRADLPSVQSSDTSDDPFNGLYKGRGKVLAPPYDVEALTALPERSDMLGQVLDAFSTVVERMGYTLERVTPPGADEPPEVGDEELEDERARAEELMEGLSGDGLSETLARARWDKILTGMRYFEVVRALPDAMPAGAEPHHGMLPVIMEHVPASTMRLTQPDETPVKVRRWRRTRTGDWEPVFQWKRCRRYVQMVGGNATWFKELGDPRFMHRDTGEWVTEEEASVLAEQGLLATEIIYDRYYSSRTAYGMGLFIGTSIDIGVNRKIDETNWLLFENGLHVPMIALVSGGMLTSESKERLGEKMAEMAGSDNWHKVLVLEAVPAESADPMDPSSTNSVRIELKPGKQFSSDDSLHQDLKKANDDKIRQRLRLPPILIGATPDYNFATAFASLLMFEVMVAWPARRESDRLFNEILFPEHNIRHHRVKSRGVKIADFAEIATIVNAATEAGAMSPNEIRSVLGDLLDLELPPIDEEWASKPIKVTEAETAAAAGSPEKTGQAARAALEAMAMAHTAKRRGPDYDNDSRPF